MASLYSVQIHDKANKQSMREIWFDDFAALYKFVHAHDRDGPDALNVHLPARATEQERQKIRDLGYVHN